MEPLQLKENSWVLKSPSKKINQNFEAGPINRSNK